MGDTMTEQEQTVWDLGTLTTTEADVPVTTSVAGATVSITPTQEKRLMHIEKSGPAFSVRRRDDGGGDDAQDEEQDEDYARAEAIYRDTHDSEL